MLEKKLFEVFFWFCNCYALLIITKRFANSNAFSWQHQTIFVTCHSRLVYLCFLEVNSPKYILKNCFNIKILRFLMMVRSVTNFDKSPMTTVTFWNVSWIFHFFIMKWLVIIFMRVNDLCKILIVKRNFSFWIYRNERLCFQLVLSF